MKRSRIGLTEIAERDNLARAFHVAARGKRGRDDVETFRRNFEIELPALAEALKSGSWTPAPLRAFRIHDPKPRLIQAPCFRDRVVHHAVMAGVGPVLDRALIDDTYACRPGKGTLAAVGRAREHAARYDWYCQIDIKTYFAGIDHGILLGLLRRRFKDHGLLMLLERIVSAYAGMPGRGLPIGTLTSQHFANFYLGSFDRHVLENPRVGGFVRYMDDAVWWTGDRASARAVCASGRAFLADRLGLVVKDPVRIGRSRDGLNFLGFRVFPRRLWLSRRRRRRYARLRLGAERAWLDGRLDARGLQAAFAGALALTAHADAASWRREHLRRHPVDPGLAAL